eukprot:CAMPEP_0119146676 /NCGR_PEP_ID=MMETSP1310-20130426/39250_1 /TAXON_ID=464262 /ORGANISM="Genus nov. species nov., Strain RCC2339" /LENGTH=89 /DNA_ID=CAMNT_0007138589 /DNA_START=148 /DNA_END=414 /DNA_ORIENTATION=-
MEAELVIVRNIPLEFGAADLRHYFESFTEGEKFRMFHFRRRSELVVVRSAEDGPPAGVERSCCIVCLQAGLVGDFVEQYHRQQWEDKSG